MRSQHLAALHVERDIFGIVFERFAYSLFGLVVSFGAGETFEVARQEILVVGLLGVEPVVKITGLFKLALIKILLGQFGLHLAEGGAGEEAYRQNRTAAQEARY